MSSRDPGKCSVCEASLTADLRRDQGDIIYFNCPQCGPFGLTPKTECSLDSLLTTPRKRTVLSYGIRRTPSRERETNVFDVEACKKIVDGDFLPTPQEQADNLLLWLGANLRGPGDNAIVTYE